MYNRKTFVQQTVKLSQDVKMTSLCYYKPNQHIMTKTQTQKVSGTL